MRYFVTLVVALAASPAFADSPEDPVRAVFPAAVRANAEARPIVLFDAATRRANLTSSFQAVVAGIDKRQTDSNQEVLDFNPVLNSNGEASDEDLAIKTLSRGDRQAIIQTTFGRGKNRRSVVYVLKLEAGAWRIDDIESAPGATGVNVWSVRKIDADDLKPRPK